MLNEFIQKQQRNSAVTEIFAKNAKNNLRIQEIPIIITYFIF